MKRRREVWPAGTAEHREHFGEVARRAAFELAQGLGVGEIDGEVYHGLPVGDRRCQGVLNKFLDLVEHGALDVFDLALAVRDLPESHNVRPLIRRKSA